MTENSPPYLAFQANHRYYLPLLKVCGYDISDIAKVKEQVQSAMKLRQEVLGSYSNLKKGTNIDFKIDCRPFLFNVKTPRFSCNLPVLCPWCFIRKRVIPATTSIRTMVVKNNLHDSHVLSSCVYINPNYDKDNFGLYLDKAFERRSNLHSKMNAVMSKVFCTHTVFRKKVTKSEVRQEAGKDITVPVTEIQRFLGSFNCGFFLHPKSEDLADLIKCNQKFAHVKFVTRTEDLSQAAVFNCFGDTLKRMNWTNIYDNENFQYLGFLIDARNLNYKYVRTYKGKINAATDIRQASLETDSSGQASS